MDGSKKAIRKNLTGNASVVSTAVTRPTYILNIPLSNLDRRNGHRNSFIFRCRPQYVQANGRIFTSNRLSSLHLSHGVVKHHASL
jgi:hypothetical protein